MRAVGWWGTLVTLALAACSGGRPARGGGGSPGTAGSDFGGSNGAGGQVGDPDGGADGIDPMDLSPSPDLGPPPPFQPLAPAEHPRLFFRSYDLPMLKAKAASGQGAVLIARLEASLGGGEALRTDLSEFTLWDGFGFGVLYQLTGEQKY